MEASTTRSPESIGIDEAVIRFGELVQRTAAGEEFVITRDGEPLARLVPEQPAPIDAAAVDAVFDELRELSTGFAPDVTIEELRGYAREGRP